MIAPVENEGTEPMTRDTQLLYDTALDTVSGGVASLIGGNTTIAHPHIPRSADLLKPQMIAKLLAVAGGFNPPIPHG
jgi:hypothetical protein